MKVSEVMTTDLVTVKVGSPLKEAAELMLKRGVSGLPVVGEDGTIVGMVTEADFVDVEATHAWSHRRSLLAPLFGRGAPALTKAQMVDDVMTETVNTVAADATVAAAARQMAVQKVKRLPVVDERGRMVGIISRADVMKAFVRDDEEIAAEIAQLLTGRALPIDPAAVEVDVDDGIVRLRGTVDARVDAQLLVDFVEHTDGVVTVHSELTWLVDDRRAVQGWAAFAQEGPDDEFV